MADILDQQEFAFLKLSGTPISVGLDDTTDNPSIWFKTDENAEAIYMSVSETQLLVATFNTAIARAKGD